MKRLAIVCLSIAFAGACLTRAQSAEEAKWLGVWQGELDGQPSVVLTLADDTGAISGTVVLNIIEKEDGQARIVAMEPHALMNPRVKGGVFAFQFKKPDGGLLDFTVRLTGQGRANIHCSNCGSDAPTVNLARAE